jgi:hypothetical protein
MGPSQTSGPTSAGAAPVAPAAPAKGGGAAGTGAGTLVLYDARDRAKLPPGVEREPKLAPEVAKLVLSALSSTYKARREDCQGAEDVTFRVTASATGAFTAPATKQAAYIVASEACDAADPGAIEATHLVIVEGDKVVMQASGKTTVSPGESLPFYGTDIRAVVDLDQDGASELLVTSNVAAQLGVEELGHLYTVAGAALKRVRAFPGVYVDGCAAGPQGKAQAQVIHYLPGAKEGASQYSADLYDAPCPASGAPKPSDFHPVKPPAAAPASPTPSSVPSAQPSS